MIDAEVDFLAIRVTRLCANGKRRYDPTGEGLSYFPCKIWRFDPENPR
jgi:hypothetical protein